LGNTGFRPLLQSAADGPVRVSDGGDPLVVGAVHQCVDHVLEHDPGRDPTSVTAQRVRRVELARVLADRGVKLDPDRLQQR
jgi:hypothetical protein